MSTQNATSVARRLAPSTIWGSPRPDSIEGRVVDLLRAEGVEQPGREVPTGWRRRRKRTPHGCFEAAGRWAIRGEATYTEGRALSRVSGSWIEHAWLTDADGGVIDLAWPDPGAAYIGVTVERPTLARAVRLYGHWGPVLPLLVGLR